MGEILPFFTRLRAARDWSAEERDRLDGLARRFAQAGLKVEVVFGATEEGDPWCVVKDQDEEILIHVARIGGVFVVHSSLDESLREGADLPEVLAERLSWEEERDEVVLPFSRAQNLLALIVAATFFYDTLGQADPAPAPVAQTHDTPAAAPPESLHADIAPLAHTAHDDAPRLLPAEAPAHAPEWRSFAFDETAGPSSHGWAEGARMSPSAALPALALFEAPSHPSADPAPALVFAVAPRSLPIASFTTTASTARGGGGGGGGGPSDSAISTTLIAHPPAPDHPTPKPVDPVIPPEPEPHPDDKTAHPPVAHETAVAHAGVDHDAVLSVGLGFGHPALA